jgi:large subunit ribosomal protein L6
MSRAGKHPQEIKQGVSVEIVNGNMIVKGPKGELTVSLSNKHSHLVDVKIEDGHVHVTPRNADDKESRSMWGTTTRNIRAAIIGVSDGFAKEMYMKGVGYRASVQGRNLVLVAGYSHDVILPIPDGLTVEIGATPTEFTVRGIDKVAVGHFADKIHKVRKSDPYKAKGIYYKGERIRRKEGKKK